jgi:cytochrome c peroxidase
MREHARLVSRIAVPCRVSMVSVLLATFARAQTIGDFPSVAVPAGNPLTPEKVELGKALFFEEQLSADDTMACATCHLPEAGGTDLRAGAREPGLDGVLGTTDDEFGSPGMLRQNAAGEYRAHAAFGFGPQATNRHAPTVIGAAFFRALFWDMRAGPQFRDLEGGLVLDGLAALETQAVAPPLSSVEMAHQARTWEQVTAKLARVRPLDLARDLPPTLAEFVGDARGYGELFRRAFGSDEITRERIAMAIASYERTLVPDRTPFDLGTMNAEQTEGLRVFEERGNCRACHTTALFSDGFAHTIFLPGHPRVVKTPTLRNVGLQRRLTSSGQFEGLAEVIEHYEDIFFFITLSSTERRAVLAFLGNALTDPRVLRREPPFDRPTLHSEVEAPGSNQYGEGWPGTGGAVPELLTRVPCHPGSSDFKIGIADGLGGAAAFLLVGEAQSLPGTNVRGVPLHVDPGALQILVGEMSDDVIVGGVETFFVPLPRDPALIGLTRYVQGWVRDPNAVGGFAATRGAVFTLFAERPRGPRAAHGSPAEAPVLPPRPRTQ